MSDRARPRPVWHPIPAAELLMLAGLVSLSIGVIRHGGPANARPILIGLGLLGLGAGEVALREHLAGFRAHRLLLAFLVTLVIHALVAIALPVTLVGPGALAFDAVVFGVASAVLQRAWARASQHIVAAGQDAEGRLDAQATDSRQTGNSIEARS